MASCNISWHWIFCIGIALFLGGSPEHAFAKETCGAVQIRSAKTEKPVVLKVDQEVLSLNYSLPSTQRAISPVCEIVFADFLEYTDSQETGFTVRFAHISSAYRPRIYFFDRNASQWKKTETILHRTEKYVEADIPSRHAIVAVLVDPRDVYEGIASWYRHAKTPQGSATHLFPLGTTLKVTNLDNGKSTTVRVTSTWTQKNPKRIIDLERTAFQKIASLGKGLTHIRLERIVPHKKAAP